MTSGATHRPSLVLATRETEKPYHLETSLYSAGYRVTTVRNEPDLFQRVRVQRPDAIVLDRALFHGEYTLCRRLRDDPTVSPVAPIVVAQHEAPTRADRIALLHAGASDVGAYLADAEELLLRLRIFLQPKHEVDQLTSECLIDRGSGLYNARGFVQRAEELAALTNRQGAPAACAVFRPLEQPASGAAADRLGRAFKAVGRLSDAIGRTHESEFAVFAPATHELAAALLVRRVRDKVTQEVGYIAERGKRVTLRTGFSASRPSHKVEAQALLERARDFLRE